MRRIRFNRHTLFSTVLNVTGLTLAFSIFMTVMVQVLYDLRYDRCYPEHEKVYRLESMLPTNPGMWYPTVSRPVIEYLKTSLPQAGAVSVYQYIKGESRLFNETGTDSPGVSLRVAYSEHDLLRVFPFEIISGDTAGYGMPRTALISARGAKKLFGDESPLGKEVCFTVGDDPRPFRIVAVYKDFPDNSSADNELILSSGLDGLENWSAWSYCCYVKLSTEEGAAAAVDSAASHIGRQVFQADVLKMRLTRLHDVYWSKDVMTDVAGKGNRSTTIVLLTVAIAVILIAVINFINFAMASVPFRIKGLNTRRVVGATRGGLIRSQLRSTIGLALLAFALSIGVMSLAATSSLASYVTASIRPQDNPALLLLSLGVAVATALAAGISPALYSTSFNPAMVLKGSFSLSAKGRSLRSVLIGVQYVISFVLLLCSMFIAVQNRYMKNYDMGFDREQVVEMEVTDKIAERGEAFRNMLLEYPGVTGVTSASRSIVSADMSGWGGDYGEGYIMYDVIGTDRWFVPFFGLEIVEGRNFVPSDDESTEGTYIFNETAMSSWPYLHSYMENGKMNIAGVVKDFHYKSMQHAMAPMALYNFGQETGAMLTTVYARIQPGGVRESMDWIRSKACELDPSLNPDDLDIHFLDETVDRLYRSEERLGRLITAAALISMLISVIGILGLVYFETQFRRKEIAVRRVHGVSVGEILLMINRYYLMITLICFIMTAPVSIVIIRHWAASFPYRSPIPVWIFLAALALITLITAVTVTLLSRSAALRNPVDSISTE